MTNISQNRREELKSQILKQVDFLSDHWTKGDDKIPFQFGGWRDEVANDIVSLLDKELEKYKEEVVAEIKKLRMPKFNDPFEHIAEVSINNTVEKVLSLIK